VRERYGAPSKETKQKTENYDTTTWIYEGPRAPGGISRMVVDFGILKPDGYQPNLVRVFVLEPKPTIFAVQTVVDGWGLPSLAGEQGGYPTMLYEAGLVVVFDKQTLWAASMTFTCLSPCRGIPRPAPRPFLLPRPEPPTAPRPGSTSPAGPRP
jgi:hypothetical protein